jgi:hypothetical protein
MVAMLAGARFVQGWGPHSHDVAEIASAKTSAGGDSGLETWRRGWSRTGNL